MVVRHWMLTSFLVFSIGLAVLGDRTPERRTTSLVELADRAPTKAGQSEHMRSKSPEPQTEARVLELRRRTQNAGPREDLFPVQSWAPPPAPPSLPPPPKAPPLPFAYVGKQQRDGEWTVFLADGPTTYVVKAQDTLLDTYRVAGVEPPILKLLYLPLKEMQTLRIE